MFTKCSPAERSNSDDYLCGLGSASQQRVPRNAVREYAYMREEHTELHENQHNYRVLPVKLRGKLFMSTHYNTRLPLINYRKWRTDR